MVQFLKYHLFDAEKDLSDNPTRWKYLLLQERGGAFTSVSVSAVPSAGDKESRVKRPAFSLSICLGGDSGRLPAVLRWAIGRSG